MPTTTTIRRYSNPFAPSAITYNEIKLNNEDIYGAGKHNTCLNLFRYFSPIDAFSSDLRRSQFQGFRPGGERTSSGPGTPGEHPDRCTAAVVLESPGDHHGDGGYPRPGRVSPARRAGAVVRVAACPHLFHSPDRLRPVASPGTRADRHLLCADDPWRHRARNQGLYKTRHLALVLL